MFVSQGAHLIQADQISHDLMRPGEEVYNEVVRHFGPEMLHQDGTVNRAKLAAVAFGTGDAHSRVEELNRIVHPEVVRKQDEWMNEIARRDPQAVAIVEAALLLEAGAAPRFDRLIVVTCTEAQRAERFAARQKIPLDAARAEVRRRMAAQLPDEKKIKAANFVIDNSGSFDQTRDQVHAIWKQLR